MSKVEVLLTTLALALVINGFAINPWLGVIALALTAFTFIIAMLKDWI